MGLVAHAVCALVYLSALVWMWTAPEQHHREQFVATSIALAWVGGTVLEWIGRPAADVPSPRLSSARALIELTAAGLIASTTGWHALLLAAALIIVVRIAMRYSYQTWGGVRAASIAATRWMLAIAVPLIARLPESSLTSAGR